MKKARKSSPLILMILTMLLLAVIPSGVFASTDYHIVVNGQEAVFDYPVLFEGWRALVPINGVFDLLEAKVTYDEKEKTIMVEDDYTRVEMTLDQKKALIYKKYDFSGIPLETTLEVAPRIDHGMGYIPLRFVAESLGAQVEWDGRTHTAFISKGNDIVSVESPADYKIILPSEIKENELKTWYEKSYQTKGIFSLVSGQDTYVLVSAGEKPTGGFKLEVESATVVRPGSLYLVTRISGPDPDAMVTTALTYPHILIKLEDQTFDVLAVEFLE